RFSGPGVDRACCWAAVRCAAIWVAMNGVSDSSGSRYRLPPHSPHRDPFFPGTGVRTRWFGTNVPFISWPAARPHITHWTLKTCISRGTRCTMSALPRHSRSRVGSAHCKYCARACQRAASGVQPAQRARFHDAVDRQDVGGRPSVDVEPVPGAPDGVERGDHLLFESLVDFVFFPEVAVAVLDPL